jgi:A118 family predicted phage portal protein
MPALAGLNDDRLMTELPTEERQPWPPLRWNPIHYDYRVWSAWWSGEPDALMRAYFSLGENSPIGRQFFSTTGEAGISAVRPGQSRGGLIGSVRRYFWGEPTPPGEKRTNYHLPVAADLSAASASLLYAQPPQLTYEDDSTVQTYLEEDLVDDGMHAKLIEAADMCAAFGGVYLRTVWDTDVADSAWLDLVSPDAAVPEFRYDRLTAVTFWSVIEDTGKKVVRHLEKHIPHSNVILHAVYEGDQQKIGRRVDLGGFPETRPIHQVAPSGVIELPDQPKDASTVVYVPNIKPNKIWRDMGPYAAPLGRSDYSGLESTFDAIDEALSSWMRDIRLGKARLIVPHSYLDNIGKGKGAVFEPEREIFSPINTLVSGETTAGLGILPQQFNIRWQEHKGTVDSLIEYALRSAGYSGQTLGLQGDIAQTATEVVARERKSLTTRAKKILYNRPALADSIYGMMTINKIVYHSKITPVRPTIEFPDVVMPDAAEMAQTISALRGVEAMSIETAISTVHPDWDTDQVAAELARIYQEENFDVLSRARVMLGSDPTDPLMQQLKEIPQVLSETDDTAEVEQDADATAGGGDVPTID